MIVYAIGFNKDSFIIEKIFDCKEKAENYLENKGYKKRKDGSYMYKNILVGVITEMDVE